ncbi:hypothetical protein FBBNIHIM_02095 [Pseudocitrobacter vendiensis]|uniref:Uncharacterized protein n=1 Tax=Pseudocitrobacter vendiensis TaxID=2488306 RepID=A0ABM9F4D0_9ENTR|nr:hypothetical protein FBBNIHIM_02095 [Pseudocitrobacter vendiensis]
MLKLSIEMAVVSLKNNAICSGISKIHKKLHIFCAQTLTEMGCNKLRGVGG